MGEYMEGSVLKTNIRKNAGSLYLLLTPEILKYLEVIEEDELVVKFECSKRWGRYIGVGKNKQEG
jgi:hypothetical protein